MRTLTIAACLVVSAIGCNGGDSSGASTTGTGGEDGASSASTGGLSTGVTSSSGPGGSTETSGGSGGSLAGSGGTGTGGGLVICDPVPALDSSGLCWMPDAACCDLIPGTDFAAKCNAATEGQQPTPIFCTAAPAPNDITCVDINPTVPLPCAWGSSHLLCCGLNP